jgi:hypothetical protein
MKRAIIACAMIENELKKVYKKTGCSLPILWMERGYHNNPINLKQNLQQAIDELQDMDDILLVFGLCGNATNGIVSRKARLIIPKFDDCINMLLYNGIRKKRAYTEPRSIYITKGWTLDSESIVAQYDNNLDTYGKEVADDIMAMMYEHYEKITIIDTNSYKMEEVLKYAHKAANLLELSIDQTKGSTIIIEKLLSGQWDENFIVQSPGQPLNTMHWELGRV